MKDLVEQMSNESTEPGEQTITPEIKKSIEHIISLLDKKKDLLEEIKDEVEAVAKKLGIKNKALTKRIALIQKEKEKGGEIISNERDIDFVKKYHNVEDNANKG